jgi:NAD(P)H-dependent FMN reductase
VKKIILFLAASSTLLAQMNVLVFAGSTRADSYNKKLANEAAEIARNLGAKVTLINLKDYPMPFYDGDLEKEGMPENAKKFRSLMMANDVIVIACPEYNSSIPAVLKNALDWASRGEKGGPSRDAFKGKQFALLSASPGQGGGSRALVHLRSVIENVGGEVLENQVSVGTAHEAFSEEKIPALKKQIQDQLVALVE